MLLLVLKNYIAYFWRPHGTTTTRKTTEMSYGTIWRMEQQQKQQTEMTFGTIW